VTRGTNEELQKELTDKRRKIRELEEELASVKKQFDEAVLTRRAEGSALLELEHYKQDNEKLVAMLGSTEEFQGFGQYATDSGSSVHFLKVHEK